MALASCANNPASEMTKAPAAKRTRDPLTPPLVFVPFGYTEAGNLAIAVNDTLIYEQAREQCDPRQVEIPSGWKKPLCLRRGFAGFGCGEYENIPGQAPPACVLKTITGLCEIYEEPKPPPPRYRTVNDCYPIKAPNEVIGKMRIHAVPKNVTPATIRQARQIGTVEASASGVLTNAVFSGTAGTNECLALTDIANQVVRVRDSYQESYLFSTPAMRAEREIAAALAAATEARNRAKSLQQEADAAAVRVRDSGAWTSNGCAAPPMGPLPPEPRGLMTSKDALGHGQAYCLLKLAVQFDDSKLVIQAAQVAEQFEYIDQAKRIGFDLSKSAACTRNSYTYDPTTIVCLQNPAACAIAAGKEQPGTLGEKISIGIAGYLYSLGQTKPDKNRIIASALESCAYRVHRACNAPRQAWLDKIEEVKEDPQRRLAYCTSQRDLFQTKSAEYARAEAAAKAATEKAAQMQLQHTAAPGRLSLADATCSYQ